MRVVAVVGFAVLASSAIHSQAPADLAFEVASVKPNKSANQQVMMVAEPNGRLTATNIKFPFFIRTAYQLQDSQILGGPSWLTSDRFDILAKGIPMHSLPNCYR